MKCAQVVCTLWLHRHLPTPSAPPGDAADRQRLAHPREPAGARPPAALPAARRPAPRWARDGHRPRGRARHQLRGDELPPAQARVGGPRRTTPSEGEGKRRLWRAASEYHSWHPSDFDGDEDSETALNWLTRDYARHFSEQYDKWLDVSTTWPTDWQDACGSSDASVLVTAEALEEMRDGDVGPHRALPPGRAGQPAGPPDRRLRLRLPPRPRPPADPRSRADRRDEPHRHVCRPLPHRRHAGSSSPSASPAGSPSGSSSGLLTLWQLERGLPWPRRSRSRRPPGSRSSLLELPTSGFADAFGRRPVFVVSAVVNVVASCVLLVAQSFWAFLAAAVLTGVFRALDSGPLEAWFVDTVHATHARRRRRRCPRRPRAPCWAAASPSARSCPVAWSGGTRSRRVGARCCRSPSSSRSTSCTSSRSSCCCASPARRRAPRRLGLRRALASAQEAPVVVRDGLRLLRRNRVLRGIVCVEVFWSVAMIVFETFQPIRLAELVGGEERAGAIMGPVAAGGWARLRPRRGPRRVVEPPHRRHPHRDRSPACSTASVPSSWGSSRDRPHSSRPTA